MFIHERIKQRRCECGMSVEDLADKLSVSRATIYRYESAEIKNMGIDKIAPLARALNTTPEYLMGWTDDSSINSVLPPKPHIHTDLSNQPTEIQLQVIQIIMQEEPSLAEIINKLHTLPPEKKEVILNLIKTM